MTLYTFVLSLMRYSLSDTMRLGYLSDMFLTGKKVVKSSTFFVVRLFSEAKIRRGFLGLCIACLNVDNYSDGCPIKIAR